MCVVLGAGASVCAHAPLISDFQQKAELVAASMPENFGHEGARIFGETVHYWTSKFKHLNIEEFYVMAELQQILGSTNPIARAGTLGLADCVQAMIAKTLAARMKGPESPAHKKLAQHLVKTGATAITLNWDLALDNALSRLGTKPGLGYDGAFDMLSSAKIANLKPKLLKLHGSLNWWVCEDSHLVVQAAVKSVADAWDVPPPICPVRPCRGKGGTLQPLMVPPTSQKLMATKQASVLRPIWNEARGCLSNSSNVVFVGYSFPQTDVQFRTFVQHALMENRGLESVKVVTSRKFGSERSRFEDHYGAILQQVPASVKVDFQYDGFESWVDTQVL